MQPQFSPGAPTAWSVDWLPVYSRDSIYWLLIPVFGLGDKTPSLIGFLWAIMPTLGFTLALAMAFWRGSRLAAFAYIAWLAVVTLGAAVMISVIFGRAPQALCSINCGYIKIFARSVAPGLWLTFASLALLWTGAGARVASWRTASAGARSVRLADAIRSLSSPARVGALIYTVGAAVWFFGFMLTPWATQGCTGFPIYWTHFVSGSCAGLDADTAMDNGSAPYLLYMFEMTGMGILVALIAVWQRGWIASAFAAMWAAPASWLMFMALRGLPAMLRNPPRLSISTAPWTMGAGPSITELGAVILWAGVVTLWVGAVRAQRAATGAAAMERMA